MALHVNRWSPDTCKCILEIVFDDEGTEPNTAYFRTITTGPEHSGLNGVALYNAVNGDNQRKNGTISEIEKEFPDIFEPYIQPETGESKTRKKWGVKTTWSFTGKDDSRTLQIELEGRTQTKEEKDRVKANLKTKFGNNKVNFI